MTEIETQLAGNLRAAGVDGALANRLAKYGALLLAANARVNLTGAGDAAALTPHLLDALSLVPWVRDGARLVDVGSGGGLPGIPLAMATGATPTLVEPIAKKAAFLRDGLVACGLDGEALAERAETVGRDSRYRGRFEIATARAVGPASTVAELTVPLVCVGGRVLLQRGAMDAREQRALEDAVLVLGATIAEEKSLEGELRIVVLEKVVATGERFPRRNGVPAKRPLGW